MNAAKYLGVTISKSLSWNSHIENITTKANRTLGFVKRNIQTKNKDIRTMAYNTLVRPHVEYALAVWSPHTKENNKKIEFVQRRAARWVSNDYSTQSSVKAMCGNLGWRSLENRRIDARHTMFYKIVYGLVAICCHTAPVIFCASGSVHPSHALSFVQANSYIYPLLPILIFPYDCCSVEQVTS